MLLRTPLQDAKTCPVQCPESATKPAIALTDVQCRLTVLFVSVAAAADPQDCTNGQIVGTLVAALGGQDTSVVVSPSTMEVRVALLPDGLGAEAAASADRAGAAAGAPVGELATILIPLAGVKQPKGLMIVGCSPMAMFLIHVKV